MSALDEAIEAVEVHGAMQKPTELAALTEILRTRSITNVLEIGGMHGGTMWTWAHYATGNLVCVDLFVLEGRLERAECDLVLVEGDSTDPATIDRVARHGPFDFIFIDGDHSFDAVRADHANWVPLLSDEGLIAYHDICHRWMSDPYYDMWRFWQELDGIPKQYEIFDPVDAWGGIGVATRSDSLDIDLPEHCYLAGTLTPPSEAVALCTKCGRGLVGGEDIICRECRSHES